MAGYYNPKKDYAAAIKAEKNPAKQAQLKAERQNKIDAMNAAGTNTKGYTNSIYGGSYSSSGKGNSSSGGDGKGNSSGGYFDKNLDYAAAIRNEKDPVKQAKLIAERQNKLNWMNASGTNTNGYTNDIYGGMPQASAPQGQYRSTDAALNNTNKAAIQPTATTQTQTATAAEAENPTAPTSFGSTDAAQRAALQAYITRQYAHQKAESGEGTYNGDGSMSLPDQTLLKSYQQKYNEAKAAGDQGGMTAAHRAAEKLRDNYRYYPLANSNGYGLGENDIGWVRDLVVRGDELGNKIVDQYNRGTVTTTTYDKDGNFVNRYTGGNIAGHDARVAKEMQRVNERLAGKENNTFAFRLSDPNDVKLSNAVLRAAKLERITVFQPLIRHLHLVAVFNFLLEHTIMVTDAAAVSRITKRCQGIQKTCCQTPQTAVSKCRIRLLILNRIEVKTQLFQCFLHCFFRTQVDDIVTKRTSHQKLHRKVIYLLCACLVKLLLSCNPVVDNHILDRIGHSLEYLLRCRLVDRSAVLVLYIFDNTLFKLFFADLAHPVLLIFVVSRFPARHISQSFSQHQTYLFRH